MQTVHGSFLSALNLILNLDRELLRIILLTCKVSGLALLISSAVGLPIGAIIGLRKFPLRGVVISLLNAFMGLPPVLAGLFLYLILSRSGPLGFMSLLYTPYAMVAAQFVLALPIVASLSHSAVVGVPPATILAARSLGATPYQVTVTVIQEARYGIMSGVIAALGMILLTLSIIINMALHFIQKRARA